MVLTELKGRPVISKQTFYFELHRKLKSSTKADFTCETFSTEKRPSVVVEGVTQLLKLTFRLPSDSFSMTVIEHVESTLLLSPQPWYS